MLEGIYYFFLLKYAGCTESNSNSVLIRAVRSMKVKHFGSGLRSGTETKHRHYLFYCVWHSRLGLLTIRIRKQVLQQISHTLRCIVTMGCSSSSISSGGGRFGRCIGSVSFKHRDEFGQLGICSGNCGL